MTREQFILKYGILTENEFIQRFGAELEFQDDVMDWKAEFDTERLSLPKVVSEEKLKIALTEFFEKIK